MTPPLNAETVNDRAKLLYHRIVARQVATDPNLIRRARQVISEWRSRGQHYSFLDECERLLDLDPTQLRRLITQRSENMKRLRISSPLGLASGLLTNDEALCRAGSVGRRRPGCCWPQSGVPRSSHFAPDQSILLLNARRNRSQIPIAKPHSVALLSGPAI